MPETPPGFQASVFSHSGTGSQPAVAFCPRPRPCRCSQHRSHSARPAPSYRVPHLRILRVVLRVPLPLPSAFRPRLPDPSGLRPACPNALFLFRGVELARPLLGSRTPTPRPPDQSPSARTVRRETTTARGAIVRSGSDPEAAEVPGCRFSGATAVRRRRSPAATVIPGDDGPGEDGGGEIRSGRWMVPGEWRIRRGPCPGPGRGRGWVRGSGTPRSASSSGPARSPGPPRSACGSRRRRRAADAGPGCPA